jgi:signal-transduction protein with cAMP-binding, CBS, and nucleotidyltransferase domain
MPRHVLTAEFLKNFTPLHTLTDEQLARLAKRVVVEDVTKGALVCAEGDTDNDTIYLLEGGVEMRSRSSSMSRVLQAGTPDAAFPVSPRTSPALHRHGYDSGAHIPHRQR